MDINNASGKGGVAMINIIHNNLSCLGGAVRINNADTAGIMVKRDGSGDFSAGSITLDGNLNEWDGERAG